MPSRLQCLATLAPQAHASLANGLDWCAQSVLERDKLVESAQGIAFLVRSLEYDSKACPKSRQ